MQTQSISVFESWLKAVLRMFGGVSVVAIFPFVMPRSWMAVIHEWLGMGVLPDKPVVEYLARTTSALCALYGGLLLLLATDVHRYARAITYQAAATMTLSTIGAFFGLRGGMPAWWMVGDAAGCWLFSRGHAAIAKENRGPEEVRRAERILRLASR